MMNSGAESSLESVAAADHDNLPGVAGHLQNGGVVINQPSSTAGRAHKRQRVALACTRCRIKKSRCDGAQPICSMCADMGYECVYRQPTVSMRSMGGKDPILSYDERFRVIEDRLKSIERNLESNQIPAPNTPSESVQGTIAINQNTVRDHEITNSTVDAMGVMATSNETDIGFYGPSSNITFMAHISRAIIATSKLIVPSAQPNSESEILLLNGNVQSSSNNHNSQNGSVKPTGVNQFALPSESVTQDLLQQFFANTGMLFPYIHEVTFYKTYAELKANNFKGVRTSWLALLNIMLASAVGSSINSKLRAKERAIESEVYYQRAQALHNGQIANGINLEVVQYLLLTVQYLQGTQRSVQTWTLHGLAVKAALQLGLQSETISRKLTPLEQEIRKRVWYGCIMLDRTLSMTFGRPSSIPDSYVRLDLPAEITEDYTPIPPPFQKFPESSLSLRFLTSTLTLYKVLWMALDTLYGQNIGALQTGDLSNIICCVVKIEQKLGKWRASLPKFLEVSSRRGAEYDRSPNAERMRRIIRLRYNNIRLLIHRPVLMSLLDRCEMDDTNKDSNEFDSCIGLNSMEICLDSAIDIISVVHSADEPRAELGAWWFSLYFTFNAALVLFAISLICTEVPGAAPRRPRIFEQIRYSFGLAVEALQHLDAGNGIVERCATYLTRLIDLGLLRSNTLEEPERSSRQPPTPATDSVYGGGGMGLQSNVPRAMFEEVWDPIDMELGEFMQNGDFDLVMDMFDSRRNPNN